VQKNENMKCAKVVREQGTNLKLCFETKKATYKSHLHCTTQSEKPWFPKQILAKQQFTMFGKTLVQIG